MEDFARKENIPIIPHETVAYFRFSWKQCSLKNSGNWDGYRFSALLMAEHAPKAKITTIDRNPEMIDLPRKILPSLTVAKQITLLEGDAVDVLSTLTESYDFVFMDSAKSKYIVFLPEILKHLDVGGVVVWMIFSKVVMLLRILWKSVVVSELFRGLQRLFDATLDNPGLTRNTSTSGDGILMLL